MKQLEYIECKGVEMLRSEGKITEKLAEMLIWFSKITPELMVTEKC